LDQTDVSFFGCEDESDDQTKIKRLLGLYSRVFTEDPLPVVNTFDENNIYLDKVDIFPLDVTISIGANNFYWPVMYLKTSIF